MTYNFQNAFSKLKSHSFVTLFVKYSMPTYY